MPADQVAKVDPPDQMPADQDALMDVGLGYVNFFQDCVGAPKIVRIPENCLTVHDWGRSSILWPGRFQGKSYINLFDGSDDMYVKRLYSNAASGRLKRGQILDYMHFVGAYRLQEVFGFGHSPSPNDTQCKSPSDASFKTPFYERNRFFSCD
jgi:hypothetical protein